MGLPTAQEVAEKWRSRAGGAGADWVSGVQRVTQSPAQAAVAAREKWVQKMTDTATHDKWASNLGSVTLQEWQAACQATGPSRYTSGIAASVQKYQSRMGGVLNHIQAGLDQLSGMPNVTIEDAIARSGQFIRHMASYRRT